MTGIRETCACGSSIRVKHPDPAPIAADWRSTHPCDRRASSERETVKGGQVEVAYTAPHRTDSALHDHLGFRRRSRTDDTEPLELLEGHR